MKQRLPFISAFVLAAVTGSGVLAWRAAVVTAQQSTANMLVVTAVVRKCFVETQQLSFGEYDPVQAHATTALDAQSTITVSCTRGSAVVIGIDNGQNASGTIRRMISGAEFLSYDLYKDDARTQRWGTAAGETLDAGVAPSRDPRQFIVYGRVASGQDVAVGAFSDTVVVTVDF